ncbi:MAG: alpha-L-fucosidase [Verrucomicrobiales bacterium]|jgi:alpha-L-fucosidase|nr:alpha-L-fucosidase [Verrucomicrobiales bacterium]
MFIHWGVYAVPAGVWQGQSPKSHNGEWIMKSMSIPVADYSALTAQFNPVKFNADEWVALAKAAGMRYLIITAKHHDGFAMFKSAQPFMMVNSTSPLALKSPKPASSPSPRAR